MSHTAYWGLWLLPAVLALSGLAMARAAALTTHSNGMRRYLNRLHAERAHNRRERQEFQAWLQITARPL
jgi:hypothetical protein